MSEQTLRDLCVFSMYFYGLKSVREVICHYGLVVDNETIAAVEKRLWL